MHNIPAITTALDIAVARGNLDLVSYLAKEGVAIDMPNQYRYMSLSLAARRGRLGVLGFLLQNGVAVDFNGARSESPVPLAVVNGHEECVDMLLRHGAAPASRSRLFVGHILVHGPISATESQATTQMQAMSIQSLMILTRLPDDIIYFP